MTRTSRKAKAPARPATPASALRDLTRAARKAALERAGEARSRTLEALSHLEKVFEERVHQAMARLGVPTSADVRALSRQVAELQASVAALKRSRARA